MRQREPATEAPKVTIFLTCTAPCAGLQLDHGVREARKQIPHLSLLVLNENGGIACNVIPCHALAPFGGASPPEDTIDMSIEFLARLLQTFLRGRRHQTRML